MCRLAIHDKVSRDPTDRAMSENPNKYVTIHAEPQQLEFDWDHHSESAPRAGYPLSTVVCDHVANVARACHDLSSEHHSSLTSYIIHCTSHYGVASSHWHEYLQGVASTMSFLPTPSYETFVRSDRVAMASDWTTVQRDLDQVWRAITSAEQHCHERSREQEERRRETEAA
jgi:hypothetical protein